MAKQKAGKARLHLLEQRGHLNVKLIDCKTIDPSSAGKPIAFQVNKVNVKAVQRKVNRRLKKHILALRKPVHHSDGGVLLLLCHVRDL